MPFSLIPFLLLVIPLAEIAAFVVVGGQIGVWWTLAMVLFTAILGSILLRIQGFGLIAQIRRETEAGRVPGRELVHGVMLLVAGVLLLTPGFVTDTMGFLLFIPPVRDAIWAFLKSRVTVVSMGGARSPFGERPSRGDDTVIDLDAEDYSDKPDPGSPWNRQDR